MTTALEQIVRPFQAPAIGTPLPNLTSKTPAPVVFIILAGQGVKSFTCDATLSVTVYNQKYPKENSGIPNPLGLSDQAAAVNDGMSNFITGSGPFV